MKITSQEGGKTKVGTGFIVRLEKDAAYIVTASHVIEGDSQPRVVFHGKESKSFPAQVKGMEGGDPRGLAVLVVLGDLPHGAEVLPVNSDFEINGGEEVTVIGFPRTPAVPWAVVPGVVMGQDGQYLVFSGVVAEGNSGSPVLLNGKVIGVVTEVLSQYGYAVPIPILHLALRGWSVPLETTPNEVKRSPEGNGTIDHLPREITSKDGAPMVFIPAGKFWMGSPDGEGDKDEHPRHQVTLDGFYMDKFEVIVARYAEFVRAKNRSKPDYWDQVDSSKHRNLPVVGVDWHDAKAYCEWAGKRLPTEAEWEKAARGTDGRTYPWGNEQPTARLANFGKDGLTTNIYDDRLAPVDNYEAGNSPYGLHHMAGNVWEWTADWYDENYYGNSPERNPTGPSGGGYRALRGGSWVDDPVNVRSATRVRDTPSLRVGHFGFRCAQDRK
ncbi:MAG: SUMF1/EgtB/PvdO family nonheme iron enzyme [Nitrospira sp.]